VEIMTLTLDRKSYGTLLAAYQPQVIQSETAYSEALVALETLLDKGENLTVEEAAIANLLAALVEDYEEKQIEPLELDSVAPHEILRHLMNAQDLRQADLVPLIGSRGLVSEMVNGKRSISKAQAKILGSFFHVSPALFI
jgi:HTH-type transcriptional regulator / antitoxin HigA